MSNRTKVRSHTLRLTVARDQQLAIVAAYLDLTTDEVIEASLLAMILELADRDSVLRLMLALSTGMEWDDLQDEANAIAYLRDSE